MITTALLILGLAGAARASELQAHYVVLGEDGAATARVITTAETCPDIQLNGKAQPMQLRVAPASVPQRTTASKPELSKGSDFPVRVCEAKISRKVSHASVEGLRLALPRKTYNRIIVMGDTGCRMKAADNAYQACNDPAAFPFARIARLAADWKPDLVVHVGDYHYRENPCPEGKAGCAGSPWGYGWDAWNADLFIPGAPLLSAAPLVLVRGNHEDCARAGQGWFRFLDPQTYSEERNCNDPAKDLTSDDSTPYAVSLGRDEQIVVMDMSVAGNKPLAADDPHVAQFRADFDRLKALTGRASLTMMATHKPILGFGAELSGGNVKLFPGNRAIQSVLTGPDQTVSLPKGVDVLLAGHVHLWQQVSFKTPHPTQLVSGFSGTLEDIVPIPEHLPPDATPAPGAEVEAFSSWVNGYGFMTLERTSRRHWTVRIWSLEGQEVNRCRLVGRHSSCHLAQVK